LFERKANKRSRDIEPATATIVDAVAEGTVAATKDAAAQAVKDAYGGLMSLIVGKTGYKAEVEDAIAKVEAKPEPPARRALLEGAEVSKDDDVMDKAKALLEKHEKAGISYQATQATSGGLGQDYSVTAGEARIPVGRVVQGDGTVGGDKEKENERSLLQTLTASLHV
jgi:hypothetical protein